MSTPNWIMVTVKTPQTAGIPIWQTSWRITWKEQNCSFHSEEQSAALWLVCRQVSPQRYDFSISDSDSVWTKEAVMELCSTLLQCPEVDNVLVGQVPSHQQDVKVTVSPMVTFLHTVKNYLQPQRISMVLRRLPFKSLIDYWFIGKREAESCKRFCFSFFQKWQILTGFSLWEDGENFGNAWHCPPALL